MKKFLLLAGIATIALSACDKVDNIYPDVASTELDFSLYPGTQQDYESTEWPTFTANANTNRNILLEDFTGHQCVFCPAAAVIAEQIEEDNHDRVFVSTIHGSPEGSGSFQALDEANGYVHDFTCPEGLAISTYFGLDWPGSNFFGNPRGTISRILDGDQPTLATADWEPFTNAALAANELKVNIQSELNYYPSTRGVFLHAEAELLDQAITNELRIVVQLHEDSLIQPQKLADNSTDYNYVHRDVLVSCIDSRPFGQELDADHMDTNGKYYFNYSYELPDQYDPSNMHLLIYVRDAVTEEIYHVIKQKIE